ncbi:MAG: thiamine diphosphokinase [Gammaproteobacteria bacterium]|nr:thiamine diphosphokinase [Gammaproteobacteria bacterium]
MIPTLSFPLTTAQVLIILNGERSESPRHICQRASNYQQVIVADGAWNDLQDIFPHDNVGVDVVVMGDGDSIQDRPLDFIETEDQDFTDFEKIIMHCIAGNIASADVYWGSGGEMDHFLGNISVAAKYHQDIELRFFDKTHNYLYAPAQCIISGAVGKQISIYPFPYCTVSSSGLLYDMSELELTLHDRQSLRNQVATEAAMVNVSGNALFFVQR